VLLTGHTGFKGSWLSLWLQKVGAVVTGYALPEPPEKSLFALAHVGDDMESVYGDVRDADGLWAVMGRFQPEIVFHLAAQPLFLQSYADPVGTYKTNVMGTVHLLEGVRSCPSCRVVVNVTSDKCYANEEWAWCYRESDPMGGVDPYSSSKGCAELVTAAYRESYFSVSERNAVAISTVRAGNVVGGGDFSRHRIVPDFITAATSGERLVLRNPDSVRPWQHVLEPLSGYLLLAEMLWEKPTAYATAWNFGPAPEDVRPVRWIVERLIKYWGTPVRWEVDSEPRPHEARLLALDSAKARVVLGWRPRWTIDQALMESVRWYKAHEAQQSMRSIALQQILTYESALDAN